MKIDSKPFQLESELLSIDEMLANNSVDMDFQPIVSSNRNDSVIVSNKAAVVCVKVRFNYLNLSSEVVKAYRIIDKVMYDIFIDNDSCVDVLHVGHYYIGVFYAPQTINIDNVLDTMGRLNAALSILDIKFKKNLDMSFGGVMAADFGEIMYSKGLAPYESWQGAPVNNVIALCEEVYSKDNKEYDGVTLISDSIKTSNPQPIGFSGILLAKRQNSFYCTYFLHNRNVADTKSPYPIKRLEVIRWFNQKSMVFNQSLS